MPRSTAFLCLLLLCMQSRAQSPGFTFTNYTRANGLSDNFVQSIFEDSRGFMWFGTREGLNRFDGSIFRTFYSHQQLGSKLPGNSNGSFFEYKPGHLVFQSDRLPVCMNTITLQFYLPASLKGKSCLKLTHLKNRGYGMSQAGFCYILDEQLNITDSLAPPLKNNGDVVICEYLDDTTYIVGSNREFFLFHTKSRKFTSYLREDDMPAKQHIMVFHYFDPLTRMLYFSNFYEGLFRYDMNGKVVQSWQLGNSPDKIPDGNVGGIYPKSDSTLWAITYSAGISILNLHTGTFTRLQHDKNDPASLIDNAVAALYTDKNNNTWAGTSGGLCKLNNTNSIIRVWRAGIKKIDPNNESLLLSVQKGSDRNMYLSTFGSPEVQKIDHNNDKITALDYTKLPPQWCSNQIGNELIFTGGSTSVTFYDPQKNKYRQTDFLKKYFPVSDVIILAFRHSNGDTWFSGNNGGGFVRFDAKDGTPHIYKKDGPRGKFRISYYASYAEDKNGDLWFGVNKSQMLLHWILKEDRFEEFDPFDGPGMNGLTKTGITDVKMDGRNNLWVGCDGGGIFSYNIVTKKLEHFGIGNGLLTNYIGSLLPDGRNRLWIGTPKGLCCYIPDDNKFISFTRDDGLPEDYFNERCSYYDSSTNRIWVGSINTLIRFDPDSLLAVQKKAFPIYIDEIIVNGRKLTDSPMDAVTLSPSANNLQFRFTGVDINNGKEIEYSYQLSGADPSWVYNENITTASYANLSPGNYTFMVRAKHKGEHEWNEIKVPFRFTIQTPWYRTIWFRALAILLISLLTWFIFRTYYQRKLDQERADLERKKAIEKERTRIATDMHDDFGASLSRIKFLSEKMQIGNPGQDNLQHDLEKISGYSDEMAEKMGEIVWALNKRYDTTGDLLSFCRAYAAEYLSEKPIRLHFYEDPVPEMQLNGEIRRNIFLVMKEALHNIVKHAEATDIWLDIRFDGEIVMIIRDNGKGFDATHVRPFSNGLTNMKKRIEDIGGTIDITSGEGTCITIRVNPAIRQNTYGSA